MYGHIEPRHRSWLTCRAAAWRPWLRNALGATEDHVSCSRKDRIAYPYRLDSHSSPLVPEAPFLEPPLTTLAMWRASRASVRGGTSILGASRTGNPVLAANDGTPPSTISQRGVWCSVWWGWRWIEREIELLAETKIRRGAWSEEALA